MISRLLINGVTEKLKFSTQMWVENEITEIIKRQKSDFPKLAIYSSLDPNISLFGAKVGIELSIPVIGCIPYEGFTSKYSSFDLTLYRKIRNFLYHTKIIGKTGDYRTYRKRTLYLLHQTNGIIFVWDKKSKNESYFYSLLSYIWKGKNYTFFHINPETKTVHTFQL